MTKCESPIEELLYQAMLSYGMIPICQMQIGPFRVDFAFIEEKVVVEADGKAYHSSRKQKAYGKRRDAFLWRYGWRVVHFTGSQIYRNPNKCAKRVRSILRETR